MTQPNLIQVLKSVLAAFVGIQTKENQQLDFSQGKISHYIVIGLIVTILFISTLAFIVSSIL